MNVETKRVVGGLGQRVHDFADWVFKTRHVQVHDGAPSYASHRYFSRAARRELDVLFDDLALSLGMRARNFGGWRLILEGDGIFVAAYGWRKTDYCSCSALLHARA